MAHDEFDALSSPFVTLHPIDARLVQDVDLLCLDAGNCIVFLDHARIADFVSKSGVPIDAQQLIQSEGAAKLAHERGLSVDCRWTFEALPGALAWGRALGTMLALAGFPRTRLESFLDQLWAEHVRRNLYSLVPTDLGAALDALRSDGVRVAVVSNSEGMLAKLFDELGILGHFDAVIDSANVGVEKPDPRIFQIALERLGIAPGEARSAGDIYSIDMLGARAAGIAGKLIDQHNRYDWVDHEKIRHAGDLHKIE